MSPWSYTGGVAVLLAVVACAGYVALRVRARLLPGWAGAPARLAEVVIVTSFLVVLSEALGTVGLFRRVPLVAAALFVALAVRRMRPAVASPGASAPPPEPGRAVAIAAGMAVFVLAVWTATVAGAFWHGMGNYDTLIYHGPMSARFVDTGWLTRLHFTHDEPTFTFGPANSELLHGLLSLPFRRDFLSPLVALACAELTLLAAWCLGRHAGAGSRAVVGAGLVVTVPMMVLTQGGQGSNDVVALSFFMSAAAILAMSGGSRGAALVAGLAAGLAAGTKIPFLVPAGAVALLVVLWPRARSAVAIWPWTLGAVATGGFWYARNLARTGNPLPWMHVPGLPVATLGEMRDQGWSLAHYAGDGRLWRSNFLPSLHKFFGPAWPLILAVPLVALIVCVVRARDVPERVVGAMGLSAFVVYVFTPFSAGGPRGTAWMFFWDLRFVTPALALGFSMLPRLPSFRGEARQRWLLVVLLVLLGATVTAKTGPWSIFPRVYRSGRDGGRLRGGARPRRGVCNRATLRGRPVRQGRVGGAGPQPSGRVRLGAPDPSHARRRGGHPAGRLPALRRRPVERRRLRGPPRQARQLLAHKRLPGVGSPCQPGRLPLRRGGGVPRRGDAGDGVAQRPARCHAGPRRGWGFCLPPRKRVIPSPVR
jgi:hypothetical protein